MSTISIKIKETNPFKLQKKTKLVQELSDLDNEVLEKLVELKKFNQARVNGGSNYDSLKTL